MKKNLVYLVAAMATASMAITSCGNDNEQVVNNAPAGPQQVGISAYLSGATTGAEVRTRAADDLQSTEFADWNTVGIYVYKTGITAPTTDYAGYQNISISDKTRNDDGEFTKWELATEKGIYFPFDQSDVDVYLYSPKQAEPQFQANSMKMAFTVKDDQFADEDYLASDFVCGNATATMNVDETDPEAVENRGKVDVELKHALTKIIFMLDVADGVTLGNISKIWMTNIQRSCYVNLNGGQVILNSSSSKDNLTIAKFVAVNDEDYDYDSDAVKAANDQVYAALAAKAKAGLAVILPAQKMTVSTNQPQIKITMAGKTATADLKLGQLTAGKCYTVKLKVEANQVTVSAVAITDWTDGGTTELNMSKFE